MEGFVTNICQFPISLSAISARISPEHANMRLGIACINTMVKRLCYNICRLEDSRLANTDINDLPSRVKANISDSLQYSPLYWSNHLCFTSDSGDLRVWEI